MSVRLFTVPEAAEQLSVRSTNTVYALIAAGKLRAVDIAATGSRSRTRIREDDLQAFIEANTRQAS